MVLGFAATTGSAFSQGADGDPVIDAQVQINSEVQGEPAWFRQFSFASDEDLAGTLISPSSEDRWGLSFGSGERWSITIDRTSRDSFGEVRLQPKEEFSAGAMFKLTPRFSVGGEVNVGGETLDVEQLTSDGDEEMEAGIRLRSAFKF